MSTNNFFISYFNEISNQIHNIDDDILLATINKINEIKQKPGKIIIIGNGGSAAIASHVSIDLTKAANIRTINFNEASLLTCFSNEGKKSICEIPK